MKKKQIKTKRTQKEILNRIEEVKEHDFMGFETSDLIDYLEYKNAKQFLRENITEKTWLEAPNGTKSPRDEIIDYLPFAFEKAYDERGLSAKRSLCHLRAWLWMDGQDNFLEENEILDYDDYGLNHLKKIAKLYDVEVPKS
jgi:hypothetical protein